MRNSSRKSNRLLPPSAVNIPASISNFVDLSNFWTRRHVPRQASHWKIQNAQVLRGYVNFFPPSCYIRTKLKFVDQPLRLGAGNWTRTNWTEVTARDFWSVVTSTGETLAFDRLQRKKKKRKEKTWLSAKMFARISIDSSDLFICFCTCFRSERKRKCKELFF